MTPKIAVNEDVVRKSRRPMKARSYMNADQLDRFLKAAKECGPREHAMFLFAVSHGARAQEICNLKLEDVNFSNDSVRVNRVKGSLQSTQTLCRIKGQPLRDEKAAFKAWLAVRPADADTYVFNTQKATKMHRATVHTLFKNIAAKAGLGGDLQHPHVLKHTAAMLMVQGGANAFLVRQQLGHKSFNSTLQYVNPSDAEASAAFIKAFSEY